MKFLSFTLILVKNGEIHFMSTYRIKETMTLHYYRTDTQSLQTKSNVVNFYTTEK